MQNNRSSQKIIVYKDKESVIVTKKEPTKKEVFFNFWIDVGVKIVRTFLSVKVWGLIAIPWLCTELLIRGYLTGDNFAMVVATTVSVIYGMREIFKISHIGNTDYDIYDMMALGGGTMNYNQQPQPQSQPQQTDLNIKDKKDIINKQEKEDHLYGGKEEFDNYKPPKFD